MNTEYSKFEQAIKDLSKPSDQKKNTKPRQTAICRLCKNHNEKILYSLGHKSICPGQFCKCSECRKVRAEQKRSAVETRKTRAVQNFSKIEEQKELRKKHNLPERIPLDPSKEITPFVIDKELILQFREEEEEGRIEEEATAPSLSKKPKSNKRRKTNELRTNKQEKNVEEIISPRYLEELLQYTLECFLRYDIRIIKSLMNEIVAIIHKYAYAKITLDDAKFCISKLFVDETSKLNELCCSISSSNMVRSPFIHGWSYSYFNGLETPQSPYFWPIWANVGSSNALPGIDNLPKSSTEPSTESSICYRPITNGQ